MLLGASDPLFRRPQRVLVAGTAGAGKTTLAARLARSLELPHVEIDALFHGAGWTPRESFAAEVEAFSAQARWITEWQYETVRPLLADRADLLVWLDFPRTRVMRQVVVRTVTRRLRRQALWNGNIEPPLWTIFTDPEHIVRWAWTPHAKTAQRIVARDRHRSDLPIVRLTSWTETQLWLAGPVHETVTVERVNDSSGSPNPPSGLAHESDWPTPATPSDIPLVASGRLYYRGMPSIIDAWSSGETGRLPSLLSEDVVFSSPVTDYRGRTRVSHLVVLIARVLEDVQPTARWNGDVETVSAFTAIIGGDHVDGMLREQRDSSGALTHVTLFLRPYRALGAAIGKMRELLDEHPLPYKQG